MKYILYSNKHCLYNFVLLHSYITPKEKRRLWITYDIKHFDIIFKSRKEDAYSYLFEYSTTRVASIVERPYISVLKNSLMKMMFSES